MKQIIPTCLILVLAGCATPVHVAHWSKVDAGMSKAEVRSLLGAPRSISKPSNREAAAPKLDAAALAKFPTELRDFSAGLVLETWSYGKSSFVFPNPEAFVVFFDSDGRVCRHRRPTRDTQNEEDSQQIGAP